MSKLIFYRLLNVVFLYVGISVLLYHFLGSVHAFETGEFNIAINCAP